MGFTPEPATPGSPPALEESSGGNWTPLFQHGCSFPSEIFRSVMLNLIRNPNINSSNVFRADISLDCPFTDGFKSESMIPPRITNFENFDLKTVVVRTMIPRNTIVDKPLDQTCLFYEQVDESGEVRSLVIYLPHISSPSESPFYHPAVRGIGFMHTSLPSSKEGTVSIHFKFFEDEPRAVKLERTAHHLLAVLYKHGQGRVAGYVKRVQHDVIIPQAVIQNTYTRLKVKYARALCQGWVEDTDPAKHVFEDLGIAAFLIELWAEMYRGKDFPGFVDIGCGNGVLVHILLEEGYKGWGFDARRRKSWPTHSLKAQENLKEMVLIPSIIQTERSMPKNSSDIPMTSMVPATTPESHETKEIQDQIQIPDDETAHHLKDQETQEVGIHDGLFPKGTFIISNHADELTPWTPILANLSESPFMMIPCCSHSLCGARFRAPPPKGVGKSPSAYNSLVVWVSDIAKHCGWVVEKEMLRIPSTRNTALIGRHRLVPFEDVDVRDLVDAMGGAVGWEEHSMKLVKGGTRGH